MNVLPREPAREPAHLLEDKKIVFIIGSPRSGTTWLQKIFGQSQDVASIFESHLFSRYLRSMSTTWKDHLGRRDGLSNIISEQEFYEWTRSFAEFCLARFAQDRPSARIIVEKTPRHTACGHQILRTFPDSYFIHVIRDPRAVVASLRAASKTWASRWVSGRIRDACSIWKSHLTEARPIAELTPRFREVRYEQLHQDGAGEILRLFEWLGEPVPAERAEQYLADSSLKQLRAAPAREADVPGPAPEQFYRKGEVDAWRAELSHIEIALVEHLTRKQMAQLGYEPVSGRRARLAAKARLRGYKAAERLEATARGFAEWMKP